jgi:hypothetical protein
MKPYKALKPFGALTRTCRLRGLLRMPSALLRKRCSAPATVYLGVSLKEVRP